MLFSSVKSHASEYLQTVVFCQDSSERQRREKWVPEIRSRPPRLYLRGAVSLKRIYCMKPPKARQRCIQSDSLENPSNAPCPPTSGECAEPGATHHFNRECPPRHDTTFSELPGQVVVYSIQSLNAVCRKHVFEARDTGCFFYRSKRP